MASSQFETVAALTCGCASMRANIARLDISDEPVIVGQHIGSELARAFAYHAARAGCEHVRRLAGLEFVEVIVDDDQAAHKLLAGPARVRRLPWTPPAGFADAVKAALDAALAGGAS